MTAPPSSPGDSGPSSNLTRRGARGGLIVVSSGWVQLAIVMGATMTLARLLSPADFGILAMAIVVVGFVDSFRDFGLSYALVHEERFDSAQADALFRLGLRLNILLALGALGLSAVAAWFFEEPRVIPVVAIITVGMFARGVTAVHGGLLERDLRFGAVAAAAIGTELGAAAVGITLALAGYGFWALAIQQAVSLLSRAGATWVISGWRPRVSGGGAAAVEGMRRYGAQTTWVRAVNQLTESFDRMIVGRLWDSATLGLYQAARRWSEIAPQQLIVSVKPVAVATLSRLRDDVALYRAVARDLFEASLLPTLALLAYLVADAENVVGLLLGDQWLDAVHAFRCLGAAAFMAAIGRQMTWVYLAEGRTGVRLRWILVSRPLYLVAVVLGVPWGSEGVAAAVALAYAIIAVPGVWFALRGSQLRGTDYWTSWWRPALTSVAAGVAVYASQRRLALDSHVALRVGAGVGVFVTAHLTGWCVLPGGRARLRGLLGRVRAAVQQG